MQTSTAGTRATAVTYSVGQRVRLGSGLMVPKEHRGREGKVLHLGINETVTVGLIGGPITLHVDDVYDADLWDRLDREHREYVSFRRAVAQRTDLELAYAELLGLHQGALDMAATCERYRGPDDVGAHQAMVLREFAGRIVEAAAELQELTSDRELFDRELWLRSESTS